MKKVFTLIGIIISITIILAISVTTFLLTTKKGNKEVETFTTDLKNASIVYLEGLKIGSKNIPIKQPNDRIYITIRC